MLKGIIVYNNIKIKVLAKATMTDIKLYMYQNEINKNYWDMMQLFDNWGEDEERFETDDFRRLDINLNKNSFKTNLRNVEVAAKIAATIKYAIAHNDKVLMEENDDSFSKIRTKLIFDEDNTQCGKIKMEYGVTCEILIKTHDLQIAIKEEEDEDVGKIFGKLQVKDDYGNKMSKTPILNKSYKINKDLLGSMYTHKEIEHNKSVDGMIGLYETIEEVMAAHPEKNFAWLNEKKYYIVDDKMIEDGLIDEFMAHDGLIAFDTETSGLNINFKSRTGEADQLVGVVLSKEVNTSYYFPLQHKAIKNLCGGDHWFFMEHYMKDLLELKDIVTHNLNFDWAVAYIYDINTNVVYDTQYAVGVTKRYEVENYEMGLKALEKVFFGIDAFELSDFVDGEWGENEVRFWDLPYEFVRQYACPDADYTLALAHHFKKIGLVEEYEAQKIFELEIQFAKVVAYSEFWGYHIDIDGIPDMHESIVDEMNKYKKEMFDAVGYEFNPNSPVQLCKAMYDDLGIEMIGGKRSTSKDILKTLASRETIDGEPMYPFVQSLKNYRKAEGVYKGFLKKLDKEICKENGEEVVATDDGYIFPEVYQLGTNTGRVSIKNPNYQSYNDVVKKYVVPRPGFMMVDSDFGQIEYRVLASMAGQEQLIEAFNDPDLDYHTYQAARMHNIPYASVTKQLRQQSKGINFGLPYGMADGSLGVAIFGERTKENTIKARQLRKKFFKGQEKIENFFERVRSEGVNRGYTSTYFGRRRYYQKGKFDTGAIRRQAGNQVIQGTAADIYKTAVVRMFNRIAKEGLLGKVLFIGFIHDELLMEVHESIDPNWFLTVWREEYELQIEGFCRLFAGIGFGYCWYDAKKKDLPPQYVDKMINDYRSGKTGEWNGDHKKFIEDVYTGLDKFERQRVYDYIREDKNQGIAITPAISALLHDIVADETTEELNKEVGYEEKEKGFKDIQKNLRIFCKLYDVDYDSIDVRTPDENAGENSDAEVKKASNNSAESEEERTYNDMLIDMLDTNWYFIDASRDKMYIEVKNELGSNIVSIIQRIISNTCVMDKNNEIEGYKIVLHMLIGNEKKYANTAYVVRGSDVQSLVSAMNEVREMYSCTVK